MSIRALIEKLADLYPDIQAARTVLNFAEVPTGLIAFHSAKIHNWNNIYEELKKQPALLAKLFHEVIIDYAAEKAFFQKYINNLKAPEPAPAARSAP